MIILLYLKYFNFTSKLLQSQLQCYFKLYFNITSKLLYDHFNVTQYSFYNYSLHSAKLHLNLFWGSSVPVFSFPSVELNSSSMLSNSIIPSYPLFCSERSFCFFLIFSSIAANVCFLPYSYFQLPTEQLKIRQTYV